LCVSNTSTKLLYTTALVQGDVDPLDTAKLVVATRSSSITIYIVERQLACFVHLCHYPLHWLRL